MFTTMCLSESSSMALGLWTSGSRVLSVVLLVLDPRHPSSFALDQSKVACTQLRPSEAESKLTIPAAATPRSSPSSNEHALHNSLLDMYPHRLHVSVAPHMSLKGGTGGFLDETHAVISVPPSLLPLPQRPLQSE